MRLESLEIMESGSEPHKELSLRVLHLSATGMDRATSVLPKSADVIEICCNAKYMGDDVLSRNGPARQFCTCSHLAQLTVTSSCASGRSVDGCGQL